MGLKDSNLFNPVAIVNYLGQGPFQETNLESFYTKVAKKTNLDYQNVKSFLESLFRSKALKVVEKSSVLNVQSRETTERILIRLRSQTLALTLAKSWPNLQRTSQVKDKHAEQIPVKEREKHKLQELIQGLATWLTSAGYKFEISDDCIFIKLGNRTPSQGVVLFLMDQKSFEIQKYLKAECVSVMRVSEVLQRLNHLNRWLFRRVRRNSQGREEDVLTFFGWHSYYDRQQRTLALIAAASIMSEKRVLLVLSEMRNRWPGDSRRKEENIESVIEDYSWFKSFYGNSKYYLCQMSVNSMLRDKWLKVRENIKLAQTTKVAKRYLVVY
jgi:hypothetical protein